MRLVLTAALAAFIGSVGVANAADLRDERGSLKDEPVSYASLSWAGFYAGIHAGAGWSDIEATDLDGFNPPDDRTFDLDNTGFLAGVQLGYNWQAGSLVLGVEGELGYLGVDAEKADFDASVPGAVNNTVAKYESDFYGTLAARLGIAYENVLIYAKGGAAFLNTDTSVDNDPGLLGSTLHISGSDVLAGWVLGAGVEYALADGWSFKVEYLHFDFEDVTISGLDSDENTFRFNFDGKVDTVKAGLNYRFGADEEPLK